MQARRRPQQRNYGENEAWLQVSRCIPVATECYVILLLTNRLRSAYEGKPIVS